MEWDEIGWDIWQETMVHFMATILYLHVTDCLDSAQLLNEITWENILSLSFLSVKEKLALPKQNTVSDCVFKILGGNILMSVIKQMETVIMASFPSFQVKGQARPLVEVFTFEPCDHIHKRAWDKSTTADNVPLWQ